MKKIISIFLVVVLISAIFTGCNVADQEMASDDVGEVTGEVSEEVKEPITIKWLDYNGYGLEEMDEVFAELAEEGIIVEVEHVANDYYVVLNTRINSGDIPDIFITEYGKYGAEYAEYTYDLANEPIVDQFADWAIEANYVGDELIGLPLNLEMFSIIYNKDLFEQAGITELPKTQDELVQVCDQLVAAGITPFSNGYKEWWVLFLHQSSAFMMANGDTPQELADKLNSGETSFAEMPYMSNYLDFIDISVKYGLPKPLETDWETEEVNVALGEAAMMHMGQWCEPILTEANPDVNVAFLPMPISDDPAKAAISSKSTSPSPAAK